MTTGQDWRALAAAARTAQAECRLELAAERAEAAVRCADPTDADYDDVAILAATVLRQDGRAGAAVAVLTQAARYRQHSAALQNHLGLALRAACRHDEALAAFQRAARLDPDNPWAETNVAFSLLRDPIDAGATFAAFTDGADHAGGLGLFCDRFPHTYGFLLQQFQTYLRHFPDCRAYSFGRKVLEPYDRGQFAAAMDGWSAAFPAQAGQVSQLVPALDAAPAQARVTRLRLAKGRDFHRPALAHNIFAMNADLFRPLYEQVGIDFTFTLNPGGGFRLDDAYSDDRLRRVFASPRFQRVIVTYGLTRDYIRHRFGVPDDRITLIPGTIVVESLLMAHRRPKRRFGIDKMTLDICFGGVRYTPTGTDKGYDLFIAAAHRLKDRFPQLRFHVFGDYTPDILDVGALGERIRFYGLQPQSWLAGFYADMDAIVSPNRPHQITRGAFDGFPVTTCIEAAMCGAALFATDPMKLNFALTDGLDYVAIDADAARLAACLESWLTRPDALYALAAAGEQTTRAVWGEAAQMGPRVALFKRLLGR